MNRSAAVPAAPVAAVVLGLCLAACGGAGDGAGPEPATASAGAWFEEITAVAGVDFVHRTGATGELLMPEIMGAGAAVFDGDGDGDLDLYLVNGGGDPAHGTRTAGGPVNRYYRQEDGRFTDATAASGLGDPGYGMGVAVGDVDNDGDVDVYLTNFGPDRLYLNAGDGTFRDATEAAGIAVGGFSASAVFCDLDRDGLLDLYVTRYVRFDPDTECKDPSGRREFCGPDAFPDAQDVLLRNLGGGRFRDVTAEAGITAVTGAGLGVVCEDFDDDGLPDLYVANDADPNQLWINGGDWSFRDEALLRGVSVNAMGLEEAGMGVVAGDFDGDGDPDLFMTHLEDETNTLYLNAGGTRGFDDRTGASGLGAPSAPYTGFGVAALDPDQDGDLDLAVVNGRVKRGDGALTDALPEPWRQYAEPNHLFVNQGDGAFRPGSAEAGDFGAPVEISRGLATGDLDGDGALDLLVSNTRGPARLYRGRAPHRGHWLIVEPWDPRLKRVALGARVTVTAGGRTLVRTANPGMSYLSSSDPRVHFGLGPAAAPERVEVRWPDGLREEFPGVGGDRAVRLVRGDGEPPA